MDPRNDLLHETTGERFWGEHFLFWGQNAARDVAFQMHFARMPFDARLHRGFLMGFLPDDVCLVVKQVGHARSDTGPGNDVIWAECIEPFKRWRIRVDGVGRLLPRAALQAAALPDGPVVPVRMDVEVTTTSKVWNIRNDAMENQVWASFHIEQGCTVSGELSYGTVSDLPSVTHRLEGPGFRDHSVGVRSEGKFRPTTWINGVFPKSGRTFGILSIGGDAPLRRGFVATKDDVREVELHDFPTWTGGDAVGERIAIGFDLDGERQTITGELWHALPSMNAEPNHYVMGFDRGLQARLVRDSPVKMDWHGEEGWGYDQRTGPCGEWRGRDDAETECNDPRG